MNKLNEKEIDKYLETITKQKRFLFPENKYTLDDVKILINLKSKYPTTSIKRIIANVGKERKKFLREFECPECNDIFIVEMNRTYFEKTLFDLYRVCNKCTRKQKEISANEIKKEESEIIRKENTKIFIEQYLNKNYEWTADIKISERYWDVRRSYYFTDRNKIIEYIKEMDYYDFLQTPYWKAVSKYKIMKAGFRCNLCNKKGKLNVHHRTYEIHGKEIDNLNELIVLCDECHEKFHNIGGYNYEK